MEIERIRRDTRALLGEDADVSYINEELLSDMAQNGEEVTVETGPEELAPEAVRGRMFFGNRIVDATRYVAFYRGSGGSEEQGCKGATVIWLQKPVAISREGSCDQGYEWYAIARER